MSLDLIAVVEEAAEAIEGVIEAGSEEEVDTAHTADHVEGKGSSILQHP